MKQPLHNMGTLAKAFTARLVAAIFMLVFMLVTSAVQAQCIVPGVTPTASNDAGFSTCYGSKITIPYSQLLANDAVPGGGNFSIVSFAGQPGITVRQVGNAFEIDPKTATGNITFTYTIKKNDGVLLFDGHYYKGVNAYTTWAQARAAAAQSNYNGRAGYLVTITSQAENDFIKANFSGDAYTGGSNVNSFNYSSYSWVTGPEGLQNGGQGQAFGYTNWSILEIPGGGDMNYVSTKNGTWSTEKGYKIKGDGYIIEYGGMETGCVDEVLATATVTIYVNPLVTLAASQVNTCVGGSIGSASLLPAGGTAPYSYDHFNYSFSDNGIDANMFNTNGGNFSTNGNLVAQSVSNFSLYQNSIVTKNIYSDGGFLRLESSFMMEANSNVVFGMAGISTPLVNQTSMPMAVNFNGGFISTIVAGTITNGGSYNTGEWVDVKIEKNGTTVSFFSRKSGETFWNLLSTGVYMGLEGAYVAGAQYYNDNTSGRGFASKNWKLSYNPDMINLAKGTYNYTVTDALGCKASTSVTINDNSNFSVQSSIANTTALNAANGSVNISSGVNPIASITSNVFSSDLAASYNASLYNILGSLFSVSNNELKGSKITDATSLWRNSFVTNQIFTDNGFMSVTVSGKFEANTRAYLGFATALKAITNEWDMPISFSYKNGNLFYNINGVPTLVGAYAAAIWYDFKIEKAGTQVKFFVKKVNEDFKMVGVSTYLGTEAAFRYGLQYYGQNGNFGAVFAKGLNITESSKLTGLKAGNYSYNVTSVGGCTSNVSFSIFDPLTVNQPSATNVTCFGLTNGAIAISAQGGKAPYQYSINRGQSFVSTANFTNLAAGSYLVIVKDALGNETPQMEVVITQPVQITASISNSGVDNICVGQSVTLTANSNLTTASYLWNNASTASSVTTNATSKFAVRVTNPATGCFVVTDTTYITVHQLPVATITTNANASSCTGLTLTAETSGLPGTYVWSSSVSSNSITDANTNSNTNKITLWPYDPNGTYSVQVTNPFGCTSVTPANFQFVNSMLEVRYTMVAVKSVNLGEATKVLSGSIGVNDISSGKITLSKFVEVKAPGAFVRAKSFSINADAVVPVRIMTPAYITMPEMLYNTATVTGSNITIADNSQNVVLDGNIYKNITIRKKCTVTITGSVFGNVQIEDGSVVTFTNTNLNMDALTIKNASNALPLTQLKFAENTDLKIRGNVSVDDFSRVNPDEVMMTMYVATIGNNSLNFNVVGNNIHINATIILPRGTLAISTDAVLGVKMKGLFVAESITSSGKAATWQAYTCTERGTMAYKSNKTITEVMTEAPATKMSVKVMNNPTTNEFILNVKSTETTPVTITMIDASGKVMERISNVQPGTNVRLGGKLHGGLYFAQVLQGNERQTVKLIKM